MGCWGAAGPSLTAVVEINQASFKIKLISPTFPLTVLGEKMVSANLCSILWTFLFLSSLVCMDNNQLMTFQQQKQVQ